MITVQYQTVEEYCPCCEQKLKEPKMGDISQFDFSDKDLDSNELVYFIENDELDEAKNYLAGELLCRKISFYAVSNPEAEVKLLDGELDKAMQYVLSKYKK